METSLDTATRGIKPVLSDFTNATTPRQRTTQPLSSTADSAVRARAALRSERSVRDLQDERDQHLAMGRLALAAELTTWIDELLAESALLALTTSPSRTHMPKPSSPLQP